MSYRSTIRRYPRTLAMPLVFCAIIALWVVAGSPKKYEASASLWVDHAAPAPSSLAQTDTFVQTTPADQEMQILTELLTTRDFRVAVAQRGPLASYLASNPSAGWGPSVLLSELKGPQPVDQQALAALSAKSVTLATTGPQVLHVTFRAGSAAVAAGTLKALLDEVNTRLSAFAQQRSRTSVAVAQAAVQSASKAVAESRQRVDAYRQSHPGVGSGDPEFVALVKAERAAGKDLIRVTARLNAVASGRADAAAGDSFTILDAPRAAPGPVSGKKKLIMAVIGGLFAGALISALALLALTPSRPPAPEGRPELREVPDVRDLEDDFAPERAQAGVDGR
jgi:uncharacterized protein involved in exopolysaccharide biosynthesis